MVDPAAVTDAVLKAVEPLIKGLSSGSRTLAGVASDVAAQVGRSISVDDVVQALRVHAQNKVPFAGRALSMSETAVAAAKAAGEKAAQEAMRQGLGRAGADAARKTATDVAMKQTARQAGARGGATIASRVAQAGRVGAQTILGLSPPAWIAIGVGTALVLIGGYIWSRGDAPVVPGARMTGENCPELVYAPRKCPWSPDGYTVGDCTPGFCFDTGPQGTYACKQESDAPNARRTDLNDVVCDPPSVARKDPCTKVILACE
jgi:hypothetical protein